MSKESLVKLMQAAAEDEQLKTKLQNVRSYEELKAVAQEKGFALGDLSAEQAQRTIGVVTGHTIELTDAELASVAGGWGDVEWLGVKGDSRVGGQMLDGGRGLEMV